MAEVGTAYVSLIPSAQGFGAKVSTEMGQAGTQAGATASKGFKGTFTKGLTALGGTMAAMFAVDKVKDFFTSAVGEARESQKVSAITAQVIKSTGGAAQVSAKQVGNLATAISNKTGIDDEAVQSASNLLLTFKNVRDEVGKDNDVFSQATQLSTDMGAALGKDPKAAAIGLGKALNDPTKGIAALSRVGVTFNATQTETIKKLQEGGDTLGAQKVILKELKSEFGGTAAASSTAGEKASVAFANLKEQIGTALLPVIDKVENVLSTKVIPAISTFLGQMQSGKGPGGQFADALTNVWKALEAIWPVIQAVFGFLANHIGVVYAIVAAVVAWEVAQLAFNAVQAVQLALLMVATPGTFLYATATTIAAAGTAIWAAATWLLTTPIGLVVLGIIALIAVVILVIKYHRQIGAFIAKVWGGIKDAIVAAIHNVLGWLRSHWKIIVSILGGPLVAAVILIASNWKKIKAVISSAVSAVASFIRSAWGKLMGWIRGAWTGLVGWLRTELGNLVSLVSSLPGRLSGLASKMLGAGKALGSALMNGIMSGLRAAGSFVSDLASSVKGAINSALHLPFTIKGPGPLPDFTIPSFAAKGGRAWGGSLVVVGEGAEPESIIPDSLMTKALANAARAGAALRTSEPLTNRALRLVVDGYEFNAYVDARAGRQVASASALDAQRERARW